MTITEINKNNEQVYDLNKLLERWNGIEGLSISIKKENDIESDIE